MFRYKYAPLKSPSRDIRLVTILPGEFDDPIRIEITHAQLESHSQDNEPKRLSLKEIQKTLPEDWTAHENLEGRVIFWNHCEGYPSWSHPDPGFPRDKCDLINQEDRKSKLKYEALSYVWGSSERCRTAIVVESREITGLRITRNLEEAIRHLRRKNDCRIMWIDDICINQNNVNERSEQVQRMGLIFSLACRVVAWLGPSSSSTGLAFSKLDYLGRQVEVTRDKWLVSRPGCNEPDWYRLGEPRPYEIVVWDAISELSSRSWFTRLWIVQEIQLGSADSILKCGHDEILWLLFRRAIICIYGKDESLHKIPWQRLEPLHKLCKNTGGKSFESTLYDHHSRSCRDSKDKIYGLMNLAPPEIATHIQVDYKISVVEVFKQAFLACAGQQKRLTQLHCCGRRHLRSISPEWPTWVPNWSLSIFITDFINSGSCASGISASRAIHMDGSRLKVTALYFSTVSWVGSQIIVDSFSDVVQTYKRIGLNQAQESQYPAGGTYQNACLQVLTLGQNRDRYRGDRGYPTLAELFEVVATAGTDEAAANGKTLNYYKNWITTRFNGQNLFSTQNGYVGTINGVPQQGDEVFIILGCDVPMLLRPSSTGEYEVIGDCYMHGIMDGEAILGPILHPWKVVLVLEDGDDRIHYVNVEAGYESTGDPRLEQIPMLPGWEPIEWERTRADPYYCTKFRNRETGEVINSDPRLFPEALEARGVPLRTITLI
ncbi:HET-domain-containing protein [Hypoxylon sp. NC0597]|nr:HET-domain-containing protein [Hypoxylon sp. NC0597]